jgi:hypothetical protein
MFHGARSRIAIGAVIGLGLLTAACSSSASNEATPSSPPPPVAVVPATNPAALPTSAQLAGQYSALDRGMLTYSPLKTLRAGTPVELHVTVIDVGQGPQLTSVPTVYHGQAVDPYDVATSAEVAVQIICTSDLACQSQTAQSSQFVSPGHDGAWAWRLTARSPGAAIVGIMAATYEKGSDVFLHTTPLWAVSLAVKAKAA